MDRALIVRKPWIDLILDNSKVWEMRSTRTKITGRIGLIEQGTGLIVGEAFLLGCGEAIDEYDAVRNFGAHQVEDLKLIRKWKYPWFLEDAKRYEKPIPYKHKIGAVIWVRIGV